MKRLPPSIREKKRYLKFRIHSERKKELGEVVDEVWDAMLSYTGTKGAGEASFWVIGNLFKKEEQQGVIKVRREKEDELRAALTLIEDIGGEKAFLEVEKVSGSLDKIKDS